MGSFKIIIFIIILAIGIVKTIMGDAKKEKASKKKPEAPSRKVAPAYPYEPYLSSPLPPPIQEDKLPQDGVIMPSYINAEGVSSISNESTIGSIEERHEMTEEERIAHAERWRQALIDSEILKRKF